MLLTSYVLGNNCGLVTRRNQIKIKYLLSVTIEPINGEILENVPSLNVKIINTTYMYLMVQHTVVCSKREQHCRQKADCLALQLCYFPSLMKMWPPANSKFALVKNSVMVSRDIRTF